MKGRMKTFIKCFSLRYLFFSCLFSLYKFTYKNINITFQIFITRNKNSTCLFKFAIFTQILYPFEVFLLVVIHISFEFLQYMFIIIHFTLHIRLILKIHMRFTYNGHFFFGVYLLMEVVVLYKIFLTFFYSYQNLFSVIESFSFLSINKFLRLDL